MTPGPLAGIRVLDLTQSVAGPLTTRMLADMGAEVIKVERPGHGDLGRNLEPFVPTPDGEEFSGRFLGLNRNKQSMTIDLKQPEGLEVIRGLIERSDVLVESFRPGVMASYQLSYDEVKVANPRLVYASISGFGQPSIAESPFADRPAFDLVAVALSGLADLIGDADGPPLRPGPIPLGDLVPALMCTIGITAALRQVANGGDGCHVDAAMYDAMLTLMERPISHYSFNGNVLRRNGGRVPHPYGVFEAANGYVAIAALAWPMWQRMFTAMQRQDLIEHPELQEAQSRYDAYERVVEPEVLAWCRQRTVDEIEATLLDHGVPVGRVQNTVDIFDCPHVAARNLLPELDIDGVGTFKVPGTPVRFSSAPPPAPTMAPRLGEHTDGVLGQVLGLDDDAIAALRQAGALG